MLEKPREYFEKSLKNSKNLKIFAKKFLQIFALKNLHIFPSKNHDYAHETDILPKLT